MYTIQDGTRHTSSYNIIWNIDITNIYSIIQLGLYAIVYGMDYSYNNIAWNIVYCSLNYSTIIYSLEYRYYRIQTEL